VAYGNYLGNVQENTPSPAIRLKNSQHIIAVENPLFLEELQMLAQQKNIANAIQKLSRDALDLCFCYCVP